MRQNKPALPAPNMTPDRLFYRGKTQLVPCFSTKPAADNRYQHHHLKDTNFIDFLRTYATRCHGEFPGDFGSEASGASWSRTPLASASRLPPSPPVSSKKYFCLLATLSAINILVLNIESSPKYFAILLIRMTGHAINLQAAITPT